MTIPTQTPADLIDMTENVLLTAWTQGADFTGMAQALLNSPVADELRAQGAIAELRAALDSGHQLQLRTHQVGQP